MCAPMLDRLETLPGPQEKALEVAVGIRNGKTNCRRTSDRPTGTARLSALTGGCDQVRSLTAEHFERALGNGANIRFCSGRESEMLIRAAAGGQSRLSQHGPEARPKLRSQFRDPKQVVDTPESRKAMRRYEPRTVVLFDRGDEGQVLVKATSHEELWWPLAPLPGPPCLSSDGRSRLPRWR